MKLVPLETGLIDLVAGWMGSHANYQWLDFGSGSQIVTAAALRIMIQRDLHCIRVYTSDADDTPIGVVALSNISTPFRSATLWYVLGNKDYAARGYTTRAVSEILALAFMAKGLDSVNAWAVDANDSSIHVLTRNHFRLIGRQRQCHYIDGRPFDRLLFDLLASEYRSL